VKESEMLKILAIVKTAYPRFDDFRDQKRLEEANRLWYRHFKTFDYKVIEKAVDKYIATGQFPPTIAEIREIALKLINPYPGAAVAWSEVKRAISSYGFYQAEAAMNSMSKLTREAVKQIGGWGEICMAKDETILMNQFNKAYERLKIDAIEILVAAGNGTMKLEEGKDYAARTALPSGS